MKTLIISGKSGSGKDASTQLVVNELKEKNKRILVIHYGDLVKYYCREYYDWDGKKDEKGRSLLQHLGTETVRAKYPEYWANSVAQFCSAVQEDFDYCFIPDARFINEITTTKLYLPDAITLRINRFLQDGTPWRNPLLTEEQHKHPSEVSLDNWKYFDYILNYKDLIQLKNFILYDVLEV